jgi:hypothetical protein
LLLTEHEARDKARDADVARQLKKLGIEVPKDPKQGKGGRNVQSRRVDGKGKGGKGKGGKGGNRRTRRQNSQRDDEPPVAGAGSPVLQASTVLFSRNCSTTAANARQGHVKKKGGVVNCLLWWVVAAGGSEYYDANLKAGDGAGATSVPRAVVDQVNPAHILLLPSTSKSVDGGLRSC